MAESAEARENSGMQPLENKSNGVRVMKRPREDVAGHTTNAPEDIEPEEKRPSFRLNPPTLIHGQAKSAQKEDEDDTTDGATKRNFLRPSILSAPTTTNLISSSISTSVNGKSATTITQAPLLVSGGLLSGQVPSSNPFLRTADEEKEPKEEFVFKSAIETRTTSENGTNTETQPDTTNGSKANVFLQMSNQASAASEEKSPDADTSGFVFGSKMEERVLKNESDSTLGGASQSDDNKQENNDFLFGKNLSDRVKVVNVEKTQTSFTTQPAESVIFQEPKNVSLSDGVTSGTCGRKLEEDAAALFAASNTKHIMPEVEVKTGEEDEKNVLQIQCKLFQYDSTTTHNWVERGRGNLRLNDKRISSSGQVFQSRLVMRTHGSLRLVLNTKIWAAMLVDRASQKSVRISAQNEDGDIGVYLVMATINDAEQIYRALEYRILHLKQLEEKEEAVQNQQENSSKQSVDEKDSQSSQPQSESSKESSSTTESAASHTFSEETKAKQAAVVKSSQQEEASNVRNDDDCGAGDGVCESTRVEEAKPVELEAASVAGDVPESRQTEDKN